MFNVFGDRAENTTTWRPEPQYRGTYSILSSCILTLVLCVWTVVHLNLPEHGEKQWWQMYRKVGWLIVGLFAPELVAFSAFQQWRDARSLTKTMVSHFRGKQSQPLPSWVKIVRKIMILCGFRSRDYFKEESPSQMRHIWTDVHSFYAVMGGFAIQPTDISTNFLASNQMRMTVTPRAIDFIAKREPDLIPYISLKEIQDKSKASALAKAIVLFQASWFVCQCITRLTQHLSVSLLELNTFGHYICALLIAFLWWHKPLDVGEPTLLRNSASQELPALLYMAENRWRLASLALKESYKLGKYGDKFEDWGMDRVPRHAVVKRVRNFPRLNHWNNKQFYIGFSFAALTYALLHLVAWESTFPSRTEQILWRISCLTIASTGIFLVLIFDLVSLVTYPLRKICWYIFPPIFTYLKWPFLISYGALYLLARVFLVVESFINLAHLPDSAFELPQWSRYFPHIG
ncbi:uncharacterized protein K452DRAFT_272338 [Aplosporella prunicola CBS 121167]|uniref:Uncharacterized protein n=1 Tax=Aplosporella prunicola CBS 121167 TaxID=1176127 RepID=A0A6A6BBH0_9PEZI|nr:uncharacterized protein K452DRAFT_272338 [Aplosporella prunicola CBS 121167]KAF2141460.1 hypothetical protein K452DRAFT_272338 [Aplosporella prunicola CBS 121167]